MCTRQRHCGDNQCKSSKVEKDEKKKKKKKKKRNQAKLESEKELKVATFFIVFFLMSFFPCEDSFKQSIKVQKLQNFQSHCKIFPVNLLHNCWYTIPQTHHCHQ